MKIPFFNIWINNLAKDEFLELFLYAIHKNQQVMVNFLNAHCFNIAQKDEAYRDTLNRSQFLLNDGIGVDIGAKILGFKFKENLNGTDLIPEIIGVCENSRLPIFLLGAKPEVLLRAKSILKSRFPKLQIAGYSDGYFKDPQALLNQIRESQAKVIIIGMGVPIQEIWADKHLRALPTVNASICGGAIFDFLSGEVKRAPNWVRKIKMEWFFRLMQEPKRLFSRYVIGNFVFLLYTIKLRKLKPTLPPLT